MQRVGLLWLGVFLSACCAHAQVTKLSFAFEDDGLVSVSEALEQLVVDGGGTLTFLVSGTLDGGAGSFFNAPVPIVVDGAGQTVVVSGGGIAMGYDNCALKNLTIVNASGSGIAVSGSNCLVENCKVGTDGATAIPNNTGNNSLRAGITISGSNNTIRNCVVSGNKRAGIIVTGAGATGNKIFGCLIGLAADGLSAIPNTEYGIRLRNGATGVDIGSTEDGERNVISGNTKSGIYLEFDNDNTDIIGNYIGVNIGGTAAIANAENGVVIGAGCSEVALENNVISGNGKSGVQLIGSDNTNNAIESNYIGLNAEGAAAIPNTDHGVVCETEVSGNYIGITTAKPNYIGGNGKDGVRMSSSSGNFVQGNFIGIGPETAAVPNGGFGINLTGNSDSNTIGTANATNGNVIVHNTGGGISITALADFNTVRGNYIGTDFLGSANLGNGGRGIFCGGNNNILGEAGAGNVIAGNLFEGIRLESFSASTNTIGGNSIGLTANGTARPNSVGIAITANCFDTLIDRNTISGNTSHGILVTGANAMGTQIKGNQIGTDATGSAARPNGGAGIKLETGATQVTIGGNEAEFRNTIAGNTGDGVWVNGAAEVTLEGNRIGIDKNGGTALPNSNGVKIDNGSSQVTIGGGLGRGNIISGNSGNGIIAEGSASNLGIHGNYIGTDETGATAVGNELAGILLDGAITGVSISRLGGGGGNIISGNGGSGVRIVGNAVTALTFKHNTVGADATGHLAIANALSGLLLEGCSNLTIGGSAGDDNMFSGNDGNGIHISGGTGIRVSSNNIGLDLEQDDKLGNGEDGVLIDGAAYTNSIGGDYNVIAGNTLAGVHISGSGTSANEVKFNLIGTNAANKAGLGNGAAGVLIDDGAADSLIGEEDGQNLISGNGTFGVQIKDAATNGNQVRYNYIGLDSQGTGALPNSSGGVEISAGAHSTRIYNCLISGNGGDGVLITGQGSSFNRVYSNIIGSDINATGGMPNFYDGVSVRDGATENTIGGYTSSSGNIIRNNQGTGVSVDGVTTVQNSIVGNSIFNHGAAGIVLSNQGNNAIAAPVILGISDKIRGSAPADSRVELFVDEFDEGQTYLGYATANGSGGFDSDADLFPYLGKYLTATATDEQGNTSAFSSPFFISCSGPVISCPADITAFAPQGQSSVLVDVPIPATAPGEPCRYEVIAVENDRTFSADASGFYPVGLTTLLYTAYDAGAGEAYCTLNILVLQDGPEGEGEAGGGDGEGLNEGVEEGELEGSAEGNLEGTGEAEDIVYHSADLNTDHDIDLSDLLRAIQLFANGGYQCDSNKATEDGYLPGAGPAHSCQPHDSDYQQQDWMIALNELLRLIQLYNAGGYHYCPGEGTEDGWCLGL